MAIVGIQLTGVELPAICDVTRMQVNALVGLFRGGDAAEMQVGVSIRSKMRQDLIAPRLAQQTLSGKPIDRRGSVSTTRPHTYQLAYAALLQI